MQILQCLHRLADDRRPGPRLKLLMTSANRTNGVSYIVNQAAGEYVSLHASPMGRRGGSMRGRPFENDIRLVVESPRDTRFLQPLDQRGRRSSRHEIECQDMFVERSRSAGNIA
jgi:hypothetical protein